MPRYSVDKFVKPQIVGDDSLPPRDSLVKFEPTPTETENHMIPFRQPGHGENSGKPISITINLPRRTQAAEWTPDQFTPEIIKLSRTAIEGPENTQEESTAALDPPTENGTAIRPPRQVRFKTSSSADTVTGQSWIDESEIYYVDQPQSWYENDSWPMIIPGSRMHSGPPDRRRRRARSRQKSSVPRYCGRRSNSPTNSDYDYSEYQEDLGLYPSTSARSRHGGSLKARSRRGSHDDNRESEQLVRYRPRKVASQAELQKREAELRKGYEEIKSQLQTEVKIRKWDPYHRAESAFLEKLRIDFSEICNQYEILSVFSPDQPLDYNDTATASRILRKSTALLKVPTEEFLPMVCRSHADLLRYDSREEHQYSLLQETITKFVEKARQKAIRTDTNLGNESSQTPLLENQPKVDKKTFDLLKKHYPFKKEVETRIVSITTLYGPRSVSQEVKNDSCSLSCLGERYLCSDQTRNDRDSHHACLWVHIPSNDRSWADVS
jgi:hypothetical protein